MNQKSPWKTHHFGNICCNLFCNHRRVSQLSVEGMFCLTSTSAVGDACHYWGTFGSDLLESREWRIDRARRSSKNSLGDFKETRTMPTLPFPSSGLGVGIDPLETWRILLMVFNLIEVFFGRNIFQRFQGCLGWCKLPSSLKKQTGIMCSHVSLWKGSDDWRSDQSKNFI